MSTIPKDSPCKPQAHGQAVPGGGLCPSCGRPRCTAAAKTRPGERCRKNPHPGASICTNHGLTGAGRAAAARARTEQAAGQILESVVWNLDAAPVTDAVGALQSLAGRLAHAADVLGGRLEDVELDGPTAQAWLRVLREQRQVLEGMERLDLQGQVVQLAQGQAALVISAWQLGLGAAPSLLPAEKDLMLRAFLGGLGRGADVVGELEGGAA